MHLGQKPSLNAGKGSVRDFLGEEGQRTDSNRDQNRITIKQGSGKSSFTQTKVANDGSRSKLEEKEVYLAGKQAAEDTIQRQDIPAGFRNYLKKYYDGIQPTDPESDR